MQILDFFSELVMNFTNLKDIFLNVFLPISDIGSDILFTIEMGMKAYLEDGFVECFICMVSCKYFILVSLAEQHYFITRVCTSTITCLTQSFCSVVKLDRQALFTIDNNYVFLCNHLNSLLIFNHVVQKIEICFVR